MNQERMNEVIDKGILEVPRKVDSAYLTGRGIPVVSSFGGAAASTMVGGEQPSSNWVNARVL